MIGHRFIAMSLYNDSDLSYVKLLYDVANDLWLFDVTCLCTMILIYPMSNYSDTITNMIVVTLFAPTMIEIEMFNTWFLHNSLM